MGKYKAVIFDLDDTLVDRNEAIKNLFYIILEKYYKNVDAIKADEMLRKFKFYDKENYGDSNKFKVLKPFFDDFPPETNMMEEVMIDFWNENLPKCFTPNKSILNLLNEIRKKMKIAIITNGVTERQKAKIINSGLDSYFETILISEEVGYRKPDKIIFDIVLDKLDLKAEEVLFVGDNLVLDINGSQGAGMTGVWFNPSAISNDTDIKPVHEIRSLEHVLELLN